MKPEPKRQPQLSCCTYSWMKQIKNYWIHWKKQLNWGIKECFSRQRNETLRGLKIEKLLSTVSSFKNASSKIIWKIEEQKATSYCWTWCKYAKYKTQKKNKRRTVTLRHFPSKHRRNDWLNIMVGLKKKPNCHKKSSRQRHWRKNSSW